ncbi:MAG: UDP-N-acetylmuramate--L-alanine ligase [Bacteroidales bacterium]|nr:UDP-N-acetylmuramate--L-alanine ligase [Candidatus Colimorpha onthohippi]
MQYYFLGIGGIGMSALARYFKLMGNEVCGYDLTPSPLTKALEQEGIDIHYDDNPECIPSHVDLCVYTPAVPKETSVYQTISNRGIPIIKRSAMLGELTRGMRCIAVAGSHGKTTTSGMITHLLHHSGIACNAFLGGISKNIGSNMLWQKDSQYIVVEADEYDRSFLQLHPTYSVITATDPDHLDIYGTHQQLLIAFEQYASQTAPGGMLLVKHNCSMMEHTSHLQNITNATAATYASDSQKADYHPTNIRTQHGDISFDLSTPKGLISNLQLTQTALYNVDNAVAACAIALQCGVTEPQLREGLKTFQGMLRRFDVRVRRPQKIYIDDYAHHPNELNACIQSVKSLYPNKRILGIFQPHLYSRTAEFFDQFADALSQLDTVILLDIYPAREKPIPGISSQLILDRITTNNKYLYSKQQVLEQLPKLQADVILTLGAGDIDRMVPAIEDLLTQ